MIVAPDFFVFGQGKQLLPDGLDWLSYLAGSIFLHNFWMAKSILPSYKFHIVHATMGTFIY